MMDLYGNGLLLGEKTLDSLWMRQNLTMNNIARVFDTCVITSFQRTPYK